MWNIKIIQYFSIFSLQFREGKLRQTLDRPWGFQEVKAPRSQDNQHMKMVRLSSLSAGRLYPPGNIPGTHFCWRLIQPKCHNVAGRIMSMRNSDTIGNRNHDLPACNCSASSNCTTALTPLLLKYKPTVFYVFCTVYFDIHAGPSGRAV